MLKQFAYKQFDFISFKNEVTKREQLSNLTDFIKVLFVKGGSHKIIDFENHRTKMDTLFFINKSQVYRLPDHGNFEGTMIYYNRYFYCVEIHDNEVSCGGILYNNVYEISSI